MPDPLLFVAWMGVMLTWFILKMEEEGQRLLDQECEQIERQAHLLCREANRPEGECPTTRVKSDEVSELAEARKELEDFLNA